MIDPKQDPRPGDVLRFPSGWERRVIEREGRFVTYASTLNGQDMGTFEITLAGWRDSVGEAEVIHVA